MIYEDDPVIKGLIRRIEYLEKKVKDLNMRTFPTVTAPLIPDPTFDEQIKKVKEIRAIVDITADGLKIVDTENPLGVIIDDKDDCLGCQ